jgi:V/A-type H+-transporting ATPase subunit F
MKEQKKKKIAVIGDEEFTLGFELAGVNQIYGAENYRENVEELLEKDEVGIVIAHSRDIEELPARVKKRVEESVEPVVVELSEQPGTEKLGEKIKRAIGIDIT